ncbi:hypothetical protein JTB14_022778 [Gonioctena quinquepunctata]|nr:hypothetical protein JTB14_022778 [Gonioctena quinquepunctata]
MEDKELRTKNNRIPVSTQTNAKTKTSQNPVIAKLTEDSSAQMNMTIIDDAVLPVDDAVLPAENKTMMAREGNNISCVNYVVKRKAKKAIKHGSQIGNRGKSLRNKKNRILKTGVKESEKQSMEKSGEEIWHTE